MGNYRRNLAILLGLVFAAVTVLSTGGPVATTASVGSADATPTIAERDLGEIQLAGKSKKKSSKKKAKKKSSKKSRKRSKKKSSSRSRASTQSHTVAPAPPPPPPPPPPPSFPEKVTVNASSRDGAVTIAQAQAGHTYRIVASGMYRWRSVRLSGQSYYRPQADAECASAGNQPFYSHLLDSTEAGADPLDLYVNNLPVEWTPIRPDSAGCSPEHLYEFFYVAVNTGTIHFKVHDSDPSDNIGFLGLTITD